MSTSALSSALIAAPNSLAAAGAAVAVPSTDHKTHIEPHKNDANGKDAKKSSTESMSDAEIEKKFTDAAIKAIKEIAADNKKRLETYAKTPDVLNEGMYYANEYFVALKDLAKTDSKRKDELEAKRKDGTFYHGLAPKDFFDIKDNPNSITGKAVNWYVLKQGKLPSEALPVMRKGVTLTDCGGTTYLAWYQALLDLFKKEKFDALFAANSKTRFSICDQDQAMPLKYLAKRINPKTIADIKPGHLCSFKGVDFYGTKHINGDGANYNVLCTEVTNAGPRFVTLGTDPEGFSPEQMAQLLVDDYNKDPLGTDTLDEKLAGDCMATYNATQLHAIKSLQKDTLTIDQFKTYGGGGIHLPNTVGLNFERVALLAKATIPRARVMMDLWALGKKINTI